MYFCHSVFVPPGVCLNLDLIFVIKKLKHQIIVTSQHTVHLLCYKHMMLSMFEDSIISGFRAYLPQHPYVKLDSPQKLLI